MSASMKKLVNDVIASLKKHPSPEKKGHSFWDYMKSQLYSESTWDKKDLKIVEGKIDELLSKLEKKDLTNLWKDTEAGLDKFDDGKKVETKEMKEDLTSDVLGQVLDRMDDNYSGGTYYTPSESYYSEEEPKPKSRKSEDEDEDLEKEPTNIDEDLNLEDEDIFEDDNLDEDEEERL